MSKCCGKTMQGQSCSRKARPSDKFCWQHLSYSNLGEQADVLQQRPKRCNYKYPAASEFIYVKSPDPGSLKDDSEPIIDIFTEPNYLANRVNLLSHFVHKLTLRKPLKDLGTIGDIPEAIRPSDLKNYAGY